MARRKPRRRVYPTISVHDEKVGTKTRFVLRWDTFDFRHVIDRRDKQGKKLTFFEKYRERGWEKGQWFTWDPEVINDIVDALKAKRVKIEDSKLTKPLKTWLKPKQITFDFNKKKRKSAIRLRSLADKIK